MSARIIFGDMKTDRTSRQRNRGDLARVLVLAALIGSAACTSQSTPTLFVPPTSDFSAPTGIAQASQATPLPSPTPVPSKTPVPASPTPCNNDLRFVQDLTIPDGTSVTPGMPVEKQWLVTNAGTCDWGEGYLLKLTSGDAMGAPTEQALYPARAGTQATLSVAFTAPQTAGTYQSAWQAFAPDGTAFGEAVYLQISVSP